MAKLTDFQNPISGQRGNLLNVGGLWQMALGGMVVMMALGLGRSLLGIVTGFLPARVAGFVRPARPAPQPAADNGPGLTVYH